jgi:excisionase family DNA binding protein
MRKRVDIIYAAQHWGVSTRTVRRWIATGMLPAVRVGGLIRIDPADLDKIARPIPTAGGGPSAA